MEHWLEQDSTYHGLCYTCCGILVGMKNSSMGPRWVIDLITHHTMSGHSTIELHLTPQYTCLCQLNLAYLCVIILCLMIQCSQLVNFLDLSISLNKHVLTRLNTIMSILCHGITVAGFLSWFLILISMP